MADECPKCGYRYPSIKLADHVRRCKAAKKVTSSSWWYGSSRMNAAQIEAARVAAYYEELRKKQDADMDAVLRQRQMRAALRAPTSTPTVLVVTTNPSAAPMLPSETAPKYVRKNSAKLASALVAEALKKGRAPDVKEKCPGCRSEFSIPQLRAHLRTCIGKPYVVPASKAGKKGVEDPVARARKAMAVGVPVDNKHPKRRHSPKVLAYDGQPRFEGGIRWEQGGNPGLGKRS
jgi:hypothetical protein